MFKLSDITLYLIADIKQNIISQLSQMNIPNNEIDLADVIIFDNAAAIINDLINLGYKLVDSKDAFRNGLLVKNLAVVQSEARVVDISDTPQDLERIKQLIQGFNEDDIYNCRDSRLYPLITLTQLSRPGVKWTFSGDSWIDYGNYVANKTYCRNGSPKLSIFIDAIKSAESLYIVRGNSFVEFANTFTGEDEIARVPYIEEKWTWKEIFYRATLIPAEFGKVKLVEKHPWKDAVKSILSDCTPRDVKMVSLNQFMRGVAE